jgi:hypothetical protein
VPGFSRTVLEQKVSDRKYRQRGYQDSDRERRPTQPGPKPQAPPPGDGRIETRADKAERKALEGRAPSMPGFHEVMRCARCGNVFTAVIAADSRCSRCGADLRTCAQCESFDTARRFECAQTIAARVSPKDVRNSCELFSPRVTIERETHSHAQPQAPNSARKAFDDLFK